MKKDANERAPSFFGHRRVLPVVVVLLNVALLAFAALLYGRYASGYQERLQEENLGNIANLNQSAALNATALIDSWNIKLEDVARYVTGHALTRDEALTVIEESNSSADRQFELIGRDYTGFLARRDGQGAFIPLSYQKSSYADLQRVLDDVEDKAHGDVRFTPEFTDGYSALKYFALYRHLPLVSETGETELYTLLLATRSSDMLAVFNGLNDFEGQSTVLLDAAGNYIVSSTDFKSTNFFQYLYVYNDLTLDERLGIERQVAAAGSGELYYRDALGRDCVFRYERMTTNNWYCVTCVPIASFRSPVLRANYAVYAVLALVALLVLDVAWLQYMNRRLRVSVQREKESGEAKTDFLSRMSHDIRTPLNGIIGLAALAREETDPAATREYLDKIQLSGQFLTGLVNDILDLSKVESGTVELNPEPYSSGDLCRYIEAVVTPLCQDKGLRFRMPEPDGLPPVMLDRLRFNQVLFNLLSNAVKYTPAGGQVELSWTRVPLSADRVLLEVSVRDDGIGMSEEFQKHMFESFSQEQQQTATTGSGLGLAIVNSLVRLMGGEIRVESRQGLGSTFTVHLEAAVCHEEQTAAPKARGAALKGRRVLLCEDNEINIMVARRLLEKWGVTVDAALNGRLGLQAFASSAPGTYDAILMDVMMPEMNGLEATRAIRALDRPDAGAVPIIAMTANAYDTDVQNCLAAGMNAHMGKPIDTQLLHDLLAENIRD